MERGSPEPFPRPLLTQSRFALDSGITLNSLPRSNIFIPSTKERIKHFFPQPQLPGYASAQDPIQDLFRSKIQDYVAGLKYHK